MLFFTFLCKTLHVVFCKMALTRIRSRFTLRRLVIKTHREHVVQEIRSKTNGNRKEGKVKRKKKRGKWEKGERKKEREKPLKKMTLEKGAVRMEAVCCLFKTAAE